MTEAEFDRLCTIEAENSPDKVDQRFANTIHRIESETGHYIDEKYSYWKLLSLIRYYSLLDSKYSKYKK